MQFSYISRKKFIQTYVIGLIAVIFIKCLNFLKHQKNGCVVEFWRDLTAKKVSLSKFCSFWIGYHVLNGPFFEWTFSLIFQPRRFERNVRNLTPSGWRVRFYYSNPTANPTWLDIWKNISRLHFSAIISNALGIYSDRNLS